MRIKKRYIVLTLICCLFNLYFLRVISNICDEDEFCIIKIIYNIGSENCLLNGDGNFDCKLREKTIKLFDLEDRNYTYIEYVYILNKEKVYDDAVYRCKNDENCINIKINNFVISCVNITEISVDKNNIDKEKFTFHMFFLGRTIAFIFIVLLFCFIIEEIIKYENIQAEERNRRRERERERELMLERQRGISIKSVDKRKNINNLIYLIPTFDFEIKNCILCFGEDDNEDDKLKLYYSDNDPSPCRFVSHKNCLIKYIDSKHGLIICVNGCSHEIFFYYHK